METFMSLAFMIFSFGFFMWGIRTVHRDHREAWERRTQEAREFGFGGKGQHNAKTLHDI